MFHFYHLKGPFCPHGSLRSNSPGKLSKHYEGKNAHFPVNLPFPSSLRLSFWLILINYSSHASSHLFIIVVSYLYTAT